MRTRGMRRFVKAAGVVSDLGWESKSLGLWTHQKELFSGADLEEEAAYVWGTCCKMDRLFPRLQQGKRNCSVESLRWSSTECEEPGTTPKAGSPLASTETGIATTVLSFCGKSHRLFKKGDSGLCWRSQYTLGSLISMQCCSRQDLCVLTSLQWLWLCRSLGEPQVFLQVPCHWNSSKFLAMCFSL